MILGNKLSSTIVTDGYIDLWQVSTGKVLPFLEKDPKGMKVPATGFVLDSR
jgi:hypothetical protein